MKPFEPGNNFWERRSKHGRDKLFETPELMWEAACEYFVWCVENPLMDMEAKVVSGGQGFGSSVEMVEMPKMRAFTLGGLCIYLDCNTAYFRTFKAQLRDNDPMKKDFNTIIAKIEDVIYEQKFTGAAAGFLNPNIIARDLGLKDSSTAELTGKDGAPIATTAKLDLSAIPDDVLLALSKANQPDD